jgi:hypothetical protein
MAVLEGAADVVHARLGKRQRPLAMRHAIFDPDLGWTSRPGFRDPDHYGASKPLTITPDGARGDGGAARYPRRRVALCLGGGNTFGTGVADEEAWPALLARQGPLFGTVNLGQEGYSLDQSLLKYLVDGRRRDHDVVILAITRELIPSLTRDSHRGRRKPRLRLDGDTLVAHDGPLPRWAAFSPALNALAAPFGDLRLVRIATDGIDALRDTPAQPSAEWIDDDTADLLVSLVGNLAREARSSGRQLVVAYLPLQRDLEHWRSHRARGLLARELAERGIPFLDLTDPIMSVVEPARRGELFQDDDAPQQYSAYGHRVVSLCFSGLLRRVFP